MHDVGEVLALERQHQERLATAHRFARSFARFYSSLAFLTMHAFLIAGWLVVNTASLGVRHVDPFPFPLLAVIVGIEVLFLSAFVLMAQAKDRQQTERRALVALQLNRITDQKLATVLQLLRELQAAQGVAHQDDRQLAAFQERASLTRVAEQLDAADPE